MLLSLLVVGLAAAAGSASPSVTVHLVEDIEPGRDASQPQWLTAHDGRLFFTAMAPGLGVELWTSDGSQRGTRPVRDLVPGSHGAVPVGPFASAGGSLFFLARCFATPDQCGPVAATGQFQGQLWRTDGSGAGTEAVPNAPLVLPGSLAGAGENVYFFDAGDQSRGTNQLWASDGTAAGTQPISGRNFIHAQLAAADLDGVAVLTTFDAGPGTQVWRTDGTASGTQEIATAPKQGPDELVRFGGAVYFLAGDQLWRSDGTPSGTERLDEFGADAKVNALAATADRLFVLVGVKHYSLWSTDGSARGTQRVARIPNRLRSESPALTRLGRRVFFAAYTGRRGKHLWVSDGTGRGTHAVPSGHGRVSGELVAAGKRLFFPGDDHRHGVELWQSNRKGGRAKQVADIVPNGHGTHPTALTAVGCELYFSADRRKRGRELWVAR